MPKRNETDASADAFVEARLRSALAVSPSFDDHTPVAWSELIPSWPPETDPPPDPPPRLSAEDALRGGGRLAAFDLGRPGVRALAAVAATVVLIAGFLAWRARPQVDPVEPPPVVAASGVTASEPATAVAPATASAPAGEVVVAVGGKVKRPGLKRLPAGARVADALEAAGGAQRGVDPSVLNLARKVVDGELITVGVAPPPGAAAPGAAPGVAPGVAPGAAPPGGPLNLNTATLADLDGLPGVGPVLAQRILEARAAQGGFRAVGDLRKVSGIGSSRFEQLKDLVTV